MHAVYYMSIVPQQTSFLLLVLDRNTIDFYISILYPATLLNSLVLMMFSFFIVTTIVISGVIQINKIIKGDI